MALLPLSLKLPEGTRTAERPIHQGSKWPRSLAKSSTNFLLCELVGMPNFLPAPSWHNRPNARAQGMADASICE
jgi:hypothetical protein